MQKTQNDRHRWLSGSSRVHQIRFRTPLGELTALPWGSLQHSPRPTSWLKGGPTSKGRRREGRGMEGKGYRKGGEKEGMRGEGDETEGGKESRNTPPSIPVYAPIAVVITPVNAVHYSSVSFLPRDAYACGVRPSVYQSVTFMSCVKTNKDISEIFSPSGSHTILVFPYRTGWRYSEWNPPNEGVECKGGMKK